MLDRSTARSTSFQARVPLRLAESSASVSVTNLLVTRQGKRCEPLSDPSVFDFKELRLRHPTLNPYNSSVDRSIIMREGLFLVKT